MKACDLCGREFEKQGHLNLHKYHCKMKQKPKQEEPKIEECTHVFRLLNLRQPIENRAYQAGYKEVCTKCQEVQ